MWFGVPKHLNLPFAIIANLVQRNSHSSIEWEVKTTAEPPVLICNCILLHTSRLVTASIPLERKSKIVSNQIKYDWELRLITFSFHLYKQERKKCHKNL